jgi:hypothetical protein
MPVTTNTASAGETSLSGTIGIGIKPEILSGGTESSATVSSGGSEIVFSGGAASRLSLTPWPRLVL